MEIGAFFVLVIVVAVVAAIGAIVYAIAARRRHEELTTDAEEPGRERPTHHEVDSEQNADFVSTR